MPTRLGSRTPLRDKPISTQNSSTLERRLDTFLKPKPTHRTLSICQDLDIRAKRQESKLRRVPSLCQDLAIKQPSRILETPPPPSRHEQVHVEDWTNEVATLPSELPPSSPPSTSSANPLLGIEGFTNGLDGKEERSADDPFGFFAAEKRLKEKRMVEMPPISQRRLSPDLHDESGLGTEAFETPHHDTAMEDDHDTAMSPPRTPHKDPRKRKAFGTPTSGSDSLDPSLPSTPSPSKRKVTASTSADEPDHEQREVILPSKTKRAKHVRKGKAKAKVGDVSFDPDDPAAYSRKLEALLPRRPVRVSQPSPRRTRSHRTGSCSITKPEATSEEDEATSGPSKARRLYRGAPTTGKPGAPSKAKRARGAVKAVAASSDESAEDIEDDEMAQARQARIEYFQKLQNYEILTENVYVV